MPADAPSTFDSWIIGYVVCLKYLIYVRPRVLALQVLFELLGLQNKELQSGEDCYFTLISVFRPLGAWGSSARSLVRRIGFL